MQSAVAERSEQDRPDAARNAEHRDEISTGGTAKLDPAGAEIQPTVQVRLVAPRGLRVVIRDERPVPSHQGQVTVEGEPPRFEIT